jgi:hypothetical protein
MVFAWLIVAVVQIQWRKSSHSAYNGSCVECAGPFRKSSFSNYNGSCVETAQCVCGGGVLVRDSKDQMGPVLRFSPQAWAAFTAAIRAGEFGGS